jgi:cytochrome c biogenesis protein CcmG/thiol:disulfide interchange protein DsbE
MTAADPADAADPSDSATPLPTRRRKSRVVLWSAVATAVVLAALIAVLASSKQASEGSASSPLIGKPAPPVSGSGINLAGSYSLSRFAGKWVLVNFSASWCIPCQQETPQLVAFEQEHAPAGEAVILGIEFDEGDTPALASFLKANKATWPAVDDSQAEVSYGVRGIPESFLVDPRGTVVANFFGGVKAAEIDKTLNQLRAKA